MTKLHKYHATVSAGLVIKVVAFEGMYVPYFLSHKEGKAIPVTGRGGP
jgi:hypothetical protein